MITALPDVRSITLDEKDEFMVLACDGIWYVLAHVDEMRLLLLHRDVKKSRRRHCGY